MILPQLYQYSLFIVFYNDISNHFWNICLTFCESFKPGSHTPDFTVKSGVCDPGLKFT